MHITPAYHNIKSVSRYGIRCDQAIILKQKQNERDQKREVEALRRRIEALESN